MVKDIVKGNQIFLKAEDMTTLDLNVVTDLIDTFNANRKNCVGLAANMIGFNKSPFISTGHASVLKMLLEGDIEIVNGKLVDNIGVLKI